MLILVASSQNPNFPVMFFRANLHPQISLENWDFGWFLDSGIFQIFLNFSHRFPEHSPIFAKNWDFLSRIFWEPTVSHSFVTSPQVLGNWSVEKGVVLRVSVQWIFGVFRVMPWRAMGGIGYGSYGAFHHGRFVGYPLVNLQKAMENGPVEIVDFPMKIAWWFFHGKMWQFTRGYDWHGIFLGGYVRNKMWDHHGSSGLISWDHRVWIGLWDIHSIAKQSFKHVGMASKLYIIIYIIIYI